MGMPQRNERDVDGDERWRIGHLVCGERAGVDAFAHEDARVGAQPPVKLAAAHVEVSGRLELNRQVSRSVLESLTAADLNDLARRGERGANHHRLARQTGGSR